MLATSEIFQCIIIYHSLTRPVRDIDILAFPPSPFYDYAQVLYAYQVLFGLDGYFRFLFLHFLLFFKFL